MEVKLIKVNQQEICRLFNITASTCNRWIEKGMPKNGHSYDVQACFKWKYKEDWEYFYKKVVGVSDEKTN